MKIPIEEIGIPMEEYPDKINSKIKSIIIEVLIITGLIGLAVILIMLL